jgi:hypothetical protein
VQYRLRFQQRDCFPDQDIPDAGLLIDVRFSNACRINGVRAGDSAEVLMDLGSSICTPKPTRVGVAARSGIGWLDPCEILS